MRNKSSKGVSRSKICWVILSAVILLSCSKTPTPPVEITGNAASNITFSNFSWESNGNVLTYEMTYLGGLPKNYIEFYWKAYDDKGVKIDREIAYHILKANETVRSDRSFWLAKGKVARLTLEVNY